MIDSSAVEKIIGKAVEILPGVRDLRHRLHSYPEVGENTPRTRKALCEFLGGSGFKIREPLLTSDLVADLDIGAGQTIGLRADMDALPIVDGAEVPYRGINGCSHACGHDGHAAMLAGAAVVISHLAKELKKNIRLIFQPGEEMICWGKQLVGAGCCSDLSEVYALHGWPGLPLGTVASRTGSFFAAGIHFKIRIIGRGGHAALLSDSINPHYAMASVVKKIGEVSATLKHDGSDDGLINVCCINGGSASNIVPSDVIIEGTLRSFSEKKMQRLRVDLEKVVLDCCAENGCRAEISWPLAYDLPVICSSKSVTKAMNLVSKLPGICWSEAQKQYTCEDFAFYLQKCPGALLLLGLGEDSQNLHNPAFDFNDKALLPGITMLSALAFS